MRMYVVIKLNRLIVLYSKLRRLNKKLDARINLIRSTHTN